MADVTGTRSRANLIQSPWWDLVNISPANPRMAVLKTGRRVCRVRTPGSRVSISNFQKLALRSSVIRCDLGLRTRRHVRRSCRRCVIWGLLVHRPSFLPWNMYVLGIILLGRFRKGARCRVDTAACSAGSIGTLWCRSKRPHPLPGKAGPSTQVSPMDGIRRRSKCVQRVFLTPSNGSIILLLNHTLPQKCLATGSPNSNAACIPTSSVSVVSSVAAHLVAGAVLVRPVSKYLLKWILRLVARRPAFEESHGLQ
mmetsp:Transcript_42164/g.78409  ORF Transcript_42164/g.78409 Transcript_42164/m.78409 type:complete len:254 (+) Transcript_42164:465-1226(+)